MTLRLAALPGQAEESVFAMHPVLAEPIRTEAAGHQKENVTTTFLSPKVG